MSAEFCVVCGRTDRPLVEGLCSDCFASRNTLLATESPVTVVLCPTCGRRKVGEHWERPGSPNLLTAEDLALFLRPHPEVAVRRVRWTETGQNPMVRTLSGDADVRFRGTERTQRVGLEVRLQHRSCPQCSRRSGHYYTAVLQLRGPEERTHERARPLKERLAWSWDALATEARSDWKEAVSWREERPEGWDFFLTDTLAARGIARLAKSRLGATIKESPTLAGKREGRDLYRVTFCVRIPPKPGVGTGLREPPEPHSARQKPPVER